ncbi:MAG: YceI family protein [Anaerolineae bacterium]
MTVNRRTVIIAVIALVVIVAAVLLARDWIIPTFATPSVTGVPTAENPFASSTQGSYISPNNANTNSGIQAIGFIDNTSSGFRPQQPPLYVSCTDVRHSTATPTGAAVVEATPEATLAATAAAGEPMPGKSDPIVLRIVGEESEACYQVGEIFLGDNEFNLAVGVTKSIDGFVQIDRANVAASQIGEININVAEFQSDSARRDGMIRQRFLESNKYPVAKLTDAKVVGLPARAYQDGEVLTFQIVGTLEVHETPKEVTFNVTASLTGDTLVVSGYADVKMSDFGFEAPNIAGFVAANDEMRIVLNLVARPE